MDKRKTPLISIVMPVRNAGSFLVEAVESLINQTHKNWELIAVDDYSSDKSYEILESYSKKDKRIKLFRNDKRLGVSGTANVAIQKAKGKYIARMDADDISFPCRLEKQLAYLQKNKDVIAVGGQCDVINKKGEKIGEKIFPTEAQDIKKMIFSNAPLQQPTLIVNSRLLPSNFYWYDDKHEIAEEIELLFRLFQHGKVCNLKEKVLFYRIHNNNISLKDPKKTFLLTLKARMKAIFRYGYRPTLLGVLITIMQAIIVGVLPRRLIYPL
jgi:glycosyltransferase involved in cell wall biosynthesis